MRVPSIIPSMDAKAQNPELVHTIDKAVLKYQDVLKALNQEIFSKPELCFKEFQAHDAIVTTLQGLGFTVTPHAYGIPTSFEAEYGSGGRLVIFNAEYDALPGIGHACGHNLIAVTSVAGFLATVEQLKVSGTPGRVRLLGTPAEEGGGGKVALIKKGAYENADACVMAHPAPLQSGYSVDFNGNVYVPHVATEMFKATFHGRTAHAAATPWEGVNALDAITIAYSAISMLRQQKKSSDIIHGIITSGGTASNIIPDTCSLNYGVRAPTMARVRELKQRVVNCFHGAAMATGCTVDVEDLQVYADLRPNKLLSLQFTSDMNKWNYPVFCDISITDPPGGGATDQGNVSYVVPAIHPIYGIEAEKGQSNHTIGFTDAAGKDNAFDRSMTIAKGLAATSWRMLSDDNFAARVKKEFDDDKKARIESGEAVGEDEMVRKWDDSGLDSRPLRICHCAHEANTVK